MPLQHYLSLLYVPKLLHHPLCLTKSFLDIRFSSFTVDLPHLFLTSDILPSQYLRPSSDTAFVTWLSRDNGSHCKHLLSLLPFLLSDLKKFKLCSVRGLKRGLRGEWPARGGGAQHRPSDLPLTPLYTQICDWEYVHKCTCACMYILRASLKFI